MTTSSEIKAALAEAYKAPEWALFFEVSDGTGAAARRHADAVAMNLWPSRGLAIFGFEIKVSRGDFKRELADPAKAEAIARFCDFWLIAAPKGLIDPKELPVGWGLFEVDDGKVCQKKAPDKREASVVDRSFFASLARASAGRDERMMESIIAARVEAERKKIEERSERSIAQRLASSNEIMKKHEAFARAIKSYGGLGDLSEAQIVRAIEVVVELGFAGNGFNGLKNVLKGIESFAARAKAIENEFAPLLFPERKSKVDGESEG